MTSFEKAFVIVLGSEGGYVDNPNDPGGRTKYGISQRSYPALDIANLTLEAAQAIYRRDYWDRVRGDDLPPPLALLVFDGAVNSGARTSTLWLQRALGVTADGMIGPATLAAAHAARGVNTCVEYISTRLMFQSGLPTWRVFGHGWTRRDIRLAYQSTTMEA